ncbi:MAG: hypothetical protein WD851_23475 [Pirellulales bacterium]
MIKSERAKLLSAVAELSEEYPDWRLGQLLANVAGWADTDIWEAEDSQLIAAAQAHLNAVSRRPSETHSVL